MNQENELAKDVGEAPEQMTMSLVEALQMLEREQKACFKAINDFSHHSGQLIQQLLGDLHKKAEKSA